MNTCHKCDEREGLTACFHWTNLSIVPDYYSCQQHLENHCQYCGYEQCKCKCFDYATVTLKVIDDIIDAFSVQFSNGKYVILNNISDVYIKDNDNDDDDDGFTLEQCPDQFLDIRCGEWKNRGNIYETVVETIDEIADLLNFFKESDGKIDGFSEQKFIEFWEETSDFTEDIVKDILFK